MKKALTLLTLILIGRGRQCFAFASEDEKHVLKLPRTDIYETPFWTRVLPVDSYRKRREEDHKERKTLVLENFRIAYEELQNQTGLIALHLGHSAPRDKKLHLVDKLGYKHIVPLEKTSFILQYKHPLLIPTFLDNLAKGNHAEAEKIIKALIHVIIKRGEKAYQIDVGSFF